MTDALNPETREIDQGIKELADRLGRLSLTSAPAPSHSDPHNTIIF